MNPKTTIGLVVALAIAVIGVWWAQSSSSTREVQEWPSGPKALYDPPLGELEAFELKAGDAPALAFVMEDRKWRMAAPVSGPSDHGTVNSDVLKIKGLEYVRSYLKDDPERPTPDLTSLDTPPRIVKLTEEGGASHVLKIGARQALSSRTYVQKEGSDTVYLVDADLNRDLRDGLADYRGKRVAEVKQQDAVRVELAGERQYTLVKTDSKWTVEAPIKGRAETTKVNELVRAVSNLRVSKFVDDAPKSLRPYALDPPRLRVVVTTETKTPKPPPEPPTSAPAEPEFEIETRTVRLAFGGTADDMIFARIDEPSSPGVFQVASSVLDQIRPTLDDLRDKKITGVNTARAQKILVSGEGSSVELNKADGKWQISLDGPGAGAAEAEFAAVDDLLKAVRDLKAIGFEAEAMPSHGFDRPRATIEVTAEGQLEPARLVIGGVTPSQTGAYVLNEGEGLVAVVKADSVAPLVVRPIAFMSRAVTKFPRSRASRIELVRGDATCVVARDGGTWRFMSPVQGGAESDRVNDILSDLSNLRGRRVVGTRDEAAHFGLDAPAVKATVTVDPLPTPPTTTQEAEPLDPGPEPPTMHTIWVARQGDSVYAMAPEGATVCEVDAKVLDDLEAELHDTRVAEIDPDRVHRVVFSGNASFAFEKAGDDWQLSGEPSFATDSAKVTELCEALRDLRAGHYVRYEGAELATYGLDRPAISVTAEMDSGSSVTVMISESGPGVGDRYAAVSVVSDRVFVIGSEDVAKLTKEVRDFQKTS